MTHHSPCTSWSDTVASIRTSRNRGAHSTAVKLNLVHMSLSKTDQKNTQLVLVFYCDGCGVGAGDAGMLLVLLLVPGLPAGADELSAQLVFCGLASSN